MAPFGRDATLGARPLAEVTDTTVDHERILYERKLRPITHAPWDRPPAPGDRFAQHLDRWDLISRNGQDIVSGIYLFTVESGSSHQAGRFMVVR